MMLWNWYLPLCSLSLLCLCRYCNQRGHQYGRLYLCIRVIWQDREVRMCLWNTDPCQERGLMQAYCSVWCWWAALNPNHKPLNWTTYHVQSWMCVKSQLAPDMLGVMLGSTAVHIFNPSCHQYMHRAFSVPGVHALCCYCALRCYSLCALWGPGVPFSSWVNSLGCTFCVTWIHSKAVLGLLECPEGG